MGLFKSREEAGESLAELLTEQGDLQGAVVLALPRGGVPVGLAVAQHLGLELDVFMVRKLGMPGHPEYAMGALASGGVVVLNPDLEGTIPPSVLDIVTRHELAELERRERLYRADREGVSVSGRTVVLVDDGSVSYTHL